MFLCRSLFCFRCLFPLDRMQKFTLLCNNLQYKVEQGNKNMNYPQKSSTCEERVLSTAKLRIESVCSLIRFSSWQKYIF
jgi:hypothetical protein